MTAQKDVFLDRFAGAIAPYIVGGRYIYYRVSAGGNRYRTAKITVHTAKKKFDAHIAEWVEFEKSYAPIINQVPRLDADYTFEMGFRCFASMIDKEKTALAKMFF